MKTLLLCLTIIIVRIIDTSLNTIRTILTIRNKKKISTIIAFFEILVWFLVVRKAVNTTENAILIALSYSLGYALGVLIGMILTDKFVITNVSMNVIIKNNSKQIVDELIKKGFDVSVSDIKGKNLKTIKHMLFIVTTNKKLPEVEEIINRYETNPFMVVTDNRKVSNGTI